MARSPICYQDNTVWENDVRCWVIYHFIKKELVASGETERQDWLKRLYEKLDRLISMAGVGVSGILLEEFVDTPERREFLLSVLRRVLNRLSSLGAEVPVSELKSMGVPEGQVEWSHGLPVDRLQRTVHKVANMFVQ